jgi:hypothetical protein
MKTKFLLIAVSAFFFACNSGTKRADIGTGTIAGTETEPVEKVKIFAPMEAGEVFYKNKEPFGATIELIGEQLFDDSIVFKVSGIEMLIKEN